MLGHLHDRAKTLLLHFKLHTCRYTRPVGIGLQLSCKRFRAFLIQGKASNFPQLEQSVVSVYTCIASVEAITASTNHSDTNSKGQSGDYQSRDMRIRQLSDLFNHGADRFKRWLGDVFKSRSRR